MGMAWASGHAAAPRAPGPAPRRTAHASPRVPWRVPSWVTTGDIESSEESQLTRYPPGVGYQGCVLKSIFRNSLTRRARINTCSHCTRHNVHDARLPPRLFATVTLT